MSSCRGAHSDLFIAGNPVPRVPFCSRPALTIPRKTVPRQTRYRCVAVLAELEFERCNGIGVHLEQDVGRVEVTMAAAHLVHVRHASGDVAEHMQQCAPAAQALSGIEHALVNRIAQVASIAELLQRITLFSSL